MWELSNWRRMKGRKLFRKLLISYLLLLIVPLALGSIVYSYILNTIKNDAIQTNTLVMRQAMDMVEARMAEVESMALEVALDKGLNAFLHSNIDIRQTNLQPVREVINSLDDYSVNNDLVDFYYIYCKKDDLILMPESACLDLSLYYESIFRFEGMDYETWSREILGSHEFQAVLPARTITAKDSTKSYIVYMHALPISAISRDHMLGQVLFFLDEKKVRALMDPVLDMGASFVYIADRGGQLISSAQTGLGVMDRISLPDAVTQGSFEQDVRGQTMVISYVVSEKYGWTYLSAIPLQVFMDRVGYLRSIMIAYGCVVFFSGLIIALYMAYRNSKPFQDIIRRLGQAASGTEARTDEITMINSAITSLISSKQHLEQNMAKQRLMLRDAFFIRLINGDFHDHHEIEGLLDHIGVDISGSRLMGVFIGLNRTVPDMDNTVLKKLDLQRIVVEELLDAYPDRVLFHYAVAQNRIALLYADADEEGRSRGSYQDFFRTIYENLRKSYEIDAVFSVGKPFEDLDDAHESFTAAAQMLNYRKDDAAGFLLTYDAQSENQASYAYPIDDENKLINLAVTGNFEAIECLLGNIERVNLTERKLSVFMVRLLLYSMAGTLIKALNNPLFEKQTPAWHEQIESEISAIPDCLPVQAAFDRIRDSYRRICQYADRKKRSHNTQLIQDIVDFLQREYTNPNLSLYSVSLHFGITERYLSDFFKEQLGENFSSYVERMRIGRANELLCGTTDSITNIAHKVGYSNANTFRRAYKRLMGYRPSDHPVYGNS